MSENTNFGLLGTLIERWNVLRATLVPFSERKQEFFCTVCRYRDPLSGGTKLHDDACPVLEFDRELETAPLPALEAEKKLAASPPAQAQGWEHQHDNEACHFPGADADCDNPNHWWISKASLATLPLAHGWHAEKEQP